MLAIEIYRWPISDCNGMVQMLFGIKGKRWDLKPISKELYNSSWIRPSMEERPEHANEVENGCYW